MEFVEVFDKDETGTNPENFVQGESLKVVKGKPQKLNHSIFYESGFIMYAEKNNKGGSLLRKGADYDLVAEDTIATEISNKNCWKGVVVYKDVAEVFIDYHVYGDFVTADLVNSVKRQTIAVADNIANFGRRIDLMQDELKSHKDEMLTAHGATVETIGSSIVLRTNDGRVKTARASENNDAVNLELLKQNLDEKTQEFESKLRDTSSSINTQINAFEEILSLDEADPEGTIDVNDPEEYEKALEKKRREHSNETKPFYNAIRNENGSLAVPEAKADGEAVNKKQLEKYTSAKIAELVNNAPDTLDTLGEIAGALKKDAKVVDTLLAEINKAKEDAINTAEKAATAKTEKAETNAKAYIDDKLKAIPRPAQQVYDFSNTQAVKTGAKVKLSDGTEKDVYRLCVERGEVGNKMFFLTIPATAIDIVSITGMVYSTSINTTLENAFSIIFNDVDGIAFIPKLTDKNFEIAKIIIDFLA